MTDYIFIYCEEYSTKLKTSKFYLLDYLKKKNCKIIYFETPLTIISFFKYFKYFFKNIKKIIFFSKLDNLILTSNLCLFPFHKGFRFKILNQLNQKLNILKLNFLIRKFDLKNINVYIFSPIIGEMVKEIKNIKKISFVINDDYASFNNENSDLIEYYCCYFIKNSHITLYNSLNYFNYIVNKFNIKKKLNHKFIPHGIDKKEFNTLLKSRKSNKKEKLKFFYYGQLSKVDFKIVKIIASHFLKYEFYFIGPISKKNTQYFLTPKNLPNNIYFLDSLKKKDLLSKISNFHIAFLPFKFNKLTDYMMPIKIFEMIHMKYPIICTKNLTIEEEFGDNLFYLNGENILSSFASISDYIIKKNFVIKYDYKVLDWTEIFKKIYNE